MPYPTLRDDGRTVTLDLHGATVEEAERLAERAATEARRRGRSTLRLVHGSSTTDGVRRTIKSALHALLAGGRLGATTGQAIAGEDVLVLSLDPAGRTDPRVLSLNELL
jgi:hypothetical protein